jgi:hypothetical protein
MSEGLRFHVPPSYQGQIVEVSYALTPIGVVERTHDRSDRTTSYRVASWTAKLGRWSESSGPWNTPPPKARWRSLTTNERRELDLDKSHHATKKSPASLQREIDQALGTTRAHSTRQKSAKVTEGEIAHAMELLDAPGEGEAEAEDEVLRILMRDMSEAQARRVLRAAIAAMSRTW